MTIMTHKQITYDDFDRLLLQAGYIHGYTRGAHKLYEHTSSGTILLFPTMPGSTIVSDAHLVAARKLSVERGVVEEDEFDRLLERHSSNRPSG